MRDELGRSCNSLLCHNYVHTKGSALGLARALQNDQGSWTRKITDSSAPQTTFQQSRRSFFFLRRRLPLRHSEEDLFGASYAH